MTQSKPGPAIDDDLYSPAHIADPFSYFKTIREEDPVHWNAQYQTWVVTRYDDIVWLIRHPEIFSSAREKLDNQPPVPPIPDDDIPEHRFVREFRNHDVIRADPPDHTRLRKAINKPFTPKSMEEWRPMVREVVNDLLDQAASRGRMDVMADLAAPLPLRIIARLLGIPEADRQRVLAMANKRMSSDVGLAPDRMRVSAEGIRETIAYLAPHLEDRKRHPGNDLLTLLVEAELRGDYSGDDVQANAQGLIDAGHHTTIRLICNGTIAFLEHPAQWALLTSNPRGLAAQATEECLRYAPPQNWIRRVATRDATLRGRQIRKNDRVLWVIASANRDPEVFPNPDAFDITRSPNHHIAFGSGIHYCLGQYLARIEGQEIFAALAERFPKLRLETPVEYHHSRARMMKALQVAWN